MNQQGFTPVQRTDKRPGDFEYVWRNRELVAVEIKATRTVYSVSDALRYRNSKECV